MVKRFLPVFILIFAPASALAVNNVGSCGWGSKLFEGNEGIAPQVLAATTNGSSGSQTFGVSSGTSGCTQTGVVQSNWKTVMFFDSNMNKLARDMSAGEGESLEALADLMGMDEAAKPVFFRMTKEHFGEIFYADGIDSGQAASVLRQLLRTDPSLNRFANRI